MTEKPDGSQRVGGALAGIRVLDLSWGLSGSIATMLLADHGADVLRISRPGGDPARAVGACRTWDRGKRELELDLTDGHDVTRLRALAETSDIVVDGLGLDRARRVGCDFESLRARNPAVVHCTFGSGDDRWTGFDALAEARFGVMAESPGHRDGPIFPGHPAVIYGTALVAVIGVLAALRARLVTGTGDHVDVTNRDGVLALMTMNWWNEQQASFMDSRSRTGRLDLGRKRLLLDKFECADGRLIQVHTGAAGAFARAMDAFGLGDRISVASGPVEMATDVTERDLAILRDELPAILRSMPAEHWITRLWEHEVACLPVQPPGAVFSDPQIRHAGLMETVDDPDLGEIEVVGPVVSMSASPAPPLRPIRREEGAGVERGWIAAGLGAGGDASAELRYPLSGIRVVELSNYFALPSGNRLLRDLGADVVKVEPLHGDPIRAALPDPAEGANGGKRAIAIDLKAPEARAVIDRLVATADVFQHNMRPGAAERLGLDERSVRERHPELVYAYGPGYGSTGPMAALQSFAPLHSGFVGLMHLAAGEGNEPHTCFGNEDYYAGLLSAVGILLGLIHRDRTGDGQYVEVPQLHASVFVTSEHYISAGVIRSTLPTLDHEQTGWGPTYRIYQCLEGWVCIACVTDDQRRELRELLVPGIIEGDDRQAVLYQDVLYGRSAEEWCVDMRTRGVPCEVVREGGWLSEFLCDRQNLEDGASIEIEHPRLGTARVIGSFLHLEQRPTRRRERAPVVGEHTSEVLGELGFSVDEIVALAAAKIIAGPDLVR